MLEIVKAVAHIGVDFGYGRYELEAHHIDNARAILKNGFDTHNSYEEAQEAAFHDQLP